MSELGVMVTYRRIMRARLRCVYVLIDVPHQYICTYHGALGGHDPEVTARGHLRQGDTQRGRGGVDREGGIDRERGTEREVDVVE